MPGWRSWKSAAGSENVLVISKKGSFDALLIREPGLTVPGRMAVYV
jgi:hypothetical protein